MINLHRTLSSRRSAVAIGWAAFAALNMSWLAWGQEQSTAIAKDAIFARKILMDTISNNMDEIETMTASGKGVNLTEGREHADTISIMLMAFPHLFAGETNQWKPDVGRDTYASPEVFINYPDFYAKAASASKIAYNASRAKQEDDFKKFVVELRVACDSCHAVYLKAAQ